MKWMKVVDVIEGNTENFENCIYLWKNKVNEKRYVGQAENLRRRTMQHKNVSFNENSNAYNFPLHRAIRKYGIENFEVCILEFDLNDYGEMNEKEIYYIEKFDTLTNKQTGYNISSGGGNGNNFAGKTEEEMNEIRKKISEKLKGEKAYWYGKKRSSETKQKISKVHKGKKYSEETKQKLSEAHKGKQHSEKTKQKMSETHKGKQHSEEAKQKMSESADKRTVICTTTGKIYESTHEAERQTGVSQQNICACCKEKRKSAGKLNGEKLVWMYYQDYLESLK